MQNYLHDVTPEMIETVDKLTRTNFENATPEEIKIYGEWSAITAKQDEELRLNAERRDETAKASRELSERQAQAAIDALEALTQLAQARLKAVENGQV